eukprot:IDg266t1
MEKRVVIIDTSNEIAGDGDIPHPAIGRARRMQVARPELQHQVMIEAVENHMPEVIIIDEIGTELEALAARTIAERGVQLVGTAHGDDEAKRRGTQKSILERKASPAFHVVIEIHERNNWIVHENVDQAVDQILQGSFALTQNRKTNKEGADSLDTVELVMAIEEEFSIEIPDEDAEKIATLDQAIQFIEQAIGANHQYCLQM